MLCTVTLNKQVVIHNSSVMFSSIPVIDVLPELHSLYNYPLFHTSDKHITKRRYWLMRNIYCMEKLLLIHIIVSVLRLLEKMMWFSKASFDLNVKRISAALFP